MCGGVNDSNGDDKTYFSLLLILLSLHLFGLCFGGYSRSNASALLLLARDQLHTRCVIDGWSSFRMPLAVELSGLPVSLQSQSNNFEQHRGQGSG